MNAENKAYFCMLKMQLQLSSEGSVYVKLGGLVVTHIYLALEENLCSLVVFI